MKTKTQALIFALSLLVLSTPSAFSAGLICEYGEPGESDWKKLTIQKNSRGVYVSEFSWVDGGGVGTAPSDRYQFSNTLVTELPPCVNAKEDSRLINCRKEGGDSWLTSTIARETSIHGLGEEYYASEDSYLRLRLAATSLASRHLRNVVTEIVKYEEEWGILDIEFELNYCKGL